MEGEDLATTVLTCEGDIKDPTFPFKLQLLVDKLQNLISDEENPIKVTKVEPWNSVRVTFNIPLEAAQRLRQLAERGDRVLRELGILSVQIEGDQVITLTLASQYSEPQEIVLRKTSDEQGDVASVSFNLPSSEPVPGPSTAEPAHKNISQFLGHIVGGASSSATATASPSARLEMTAASPKPESSISFRSPNVIAPSSTEPIPFPPASIVTTTTTAASNASRVSPNISVKSNVGFGPFPFASMTHAMNTKNNTTSPQYQPVLHGGSSRLSFTTSTTQITNAILNSTCAAITSTSSVVSKVSNSTLKVPRTVSNSAFNSVVSRTPPPPNAIVAANRANVALSSPLLVNLLQSEPSNMQQNNKLMPPPSPASSQAAKRKRKPRKSKDKLLDDDVASPSFSASPSPPYQSHAGARSPGGFDPLSVLSQPLTISLTNTTISPSASPQLANIHPLAQGQPQVSNIKAQASNIHPQAQGLLPVSLQSQVQGQPMISTNRPMGQSLSAFRQSQGPRTVPNIHPQAQGQPQVHTGNLPLHTHIPVDAPHMSRTTGLQSYAMSAPRTIPMNPTRPMFGSREASSLMKVADKTNKESGLVRSDRSSAPSTPSTSTPDSNPFPSPPSSTDGSKTKHLINPFTGQLEPMPSDEEEEEESIGSLPPFPDFEIDTSEKSHSERSLSDGGKDNNLSSDTDSGISKSITDVSQSSTDGLAVELAKDTKRESKADTISTASVTSTVPGEKIKLRLKLDSKALRESKESEAKEKRLKDPNSPFNQKIDVAVVSIPSQKKNSVSAPEPRVPPLHISLRGPNSAVVVSPRKDDSKSRYATSKEDSLETSKVNQKKVRSPRTARTGEVSAVALSLGGRGADSADRRVRGNNSKDFKKIKDEFWNQNVKNISMSGGGIVEVSDKVSSSRISSYETYLSGTSVSNTVAHRKASGIFSLAARDVCKSEVMTLTSCSTGESVTLHSFAGTKSSLPLQVATVSETEVQPVDAAKTVKKEVSSSTSSIILPLGRTESANLDKVTIPSGEIPLETSLSPIEDAIPNSRHSPLTQNNDLPHSPCAPVDSKNIVQKTDCPSNQTHLQSASSVLVVSTVPLSSNSASSSTCDTNQTASSLSVQTQAGDSTDANRLPKPEGSVANPSGNVSSSTDSQNNHQCNTHSVNNGTVGNVNTAKSVQNETSLHRDSPASEVQKSTDSNKNPTANISKSSASESVINQSLDLSTPRPSNHDDDKCKNLSNHAGSSDLSSITVSKDAPVVSDKGMCTAESKKSPIAQIISVDTLPIQPHVIEVPSQQSSPAVPNTLAKSGRISEVNSVSSLLTSSGNTILSAPSLSAHGTSNLSCPEIIASSSNSAVSNAVIVVSHSSILPLPCSTSVEPKVNLLNHVDFLLEEPLTAKAIPVQSSSTNVSEESSLDSIDEERKRCMQLAEIPTSTPGPPHTDLQTVSSLKADELLKRNTRIVSPNVKPVNTAMLKPQKLDSKDLAPESHNMGILNLKSLTTTVQQSLTVNSLHTEVSLRHSASMNPIIIKESITEEKVPCTSLSESYIHPNCGLSLQKEHQPEANSTLLTSDSTSSFIVMQDSVPLVGLESKAIPIKLDGKKEVCSDSVHLVSTTSNPVVTSLLSPVKYLPNEVSSQKFKLIFKGSGQRSSLQGSNSPTGLVVPLNSSKTVPIKLVTLPGGGSALSVRSTSNPNIVEIIGPKTCTSQNTQSSSNPHSSSPVRLVVSKMPSGVNQSGTPNMRNRVVVNRVVMTGTSPSLKLVSTSSLCTTTAVLSNSGSIATSSSVQSVSSPLPNTTSLVAKLSADETKPVNNVEISSMQLSTVTCPITKETSDTIKNPPENIKHMPKATSTSTVRCSSNADSTTKDSNPSDSSVNKSKPQETVSLHPAPADSSTPNIVVSPDTTSFSNSSATNSGNITLSDTLLSVQVPLQEKSVSVLSDLSTKSISSQDGDVSSKKSTSADTTTGTATSEATSESNLINKPKTETKSQTSHEIKKPSICNLKGSSSSGSAYCESSINESNSRTLNTLAELDDSLKSEQTNDSAINSSLNYISNEIESSETADCSSSNSRPSSNNKDSLSPNPEKSSNKPDKSSNKSEKSFSKSEKSSNKPGNPSVETQENLPSANAGNSCNTENKSDSGTEPVILNSITHIDNPLVFEVANPCEIENEVTICSNVEVEVSETADVEISQNCELDGNIVIECAQNEISCKDGVLDDTNSDMQKFRPLGEESIAVVDSSEGAAEDSQLEISLVYSKPVKRKCSENAAELIKACMGVEDGPKRAVLVKAKVSEDIVEKIENEKLEENVRMSLRIRKDDPVLKKPKGSTLNSDCSTDEEITLSELVNKSRTREKQPPRGRMSSRESPVEPNNLRPGRRRSGSNESRHSEEIKTRTPRENKREAAKRNEVIPKKLPERTKRGTFKAQEQVVISKVGVQRSGRIREQEAKASLLNNNKEESNSIGAKRKTRATADTQEVLVQVKRRRYSKDGHR